MFQGQRAHHPVEGSYGIGAVSLASAVHFCLEILRLRLLRLSDTAISHALSPSGPFGTRLLSVNPEPVADIAVATQSVRRPGGLKPCPKIVATECALCPS